MRILNSASVWTGDDTSDFSFPTQTKIRKNNHCFVALNFDSSKIYNVDFCVFWKKRKTQTLQNTRRELGKHFCVTSLQTWEHATLLKNTDRQEVACKNKIFHWVHYSCSRLHRQQLQHFKSVSVTRILQIYIFIYLQKKKLELKSCAHQFAWQNSKKNREAWLVKSQFHTRHKTQNRIFFCKFTLPPMILMRFL